jgi:hypothetical protein
LGFAWNGADAVRRWSRLFVCGLEDAILDGQGLGIIFEDGDELFSSHSTVVYYEQSTFWFESRRLFSVLNGRFILPFFILLTFRWLLMQL